MSPREPPVENNLRSSFSPKILKPKIRLGRGQRWAKAVAASGMVPADHWPRGKVTHAYFLGVPFAARGGAVSGPESRRFIFPGGGLGAHFRVPVLPPGEVGQEKGDRPFEGPAGAPLPGGPGPEVHRSPRISEPRGWYVQNLRKIDFDGN